MTAVVFRPASKTAPRIPAGLLASLDVVLLERITPETFELVGEAPRWLGQLWPEATVERRGKLVARNVLSAQNAIEIDITSIYRHLGARPERQGSAWA